MIIDVETLTGCLTCNHREYNHRNKCVHYINSSKRYRWREDRESVHVIFPVLLGKILELSMKTRSLSDVLTTMHCLISVFSSVFLTGTVHISGEGMDSITIVDADEENPDEAFPKIYSCTKSLYLPRYTDKHILKKRLLYVIENFRDIGLAWKPDVVFILLWYLDIWFLHPGGLEYLNSVSRLTMQFSWVILNECVGMMVKEQWAFVQTSDSWRKKE